MKFNVVKCYNRDCYMSGILKNIKMSAFQKVSNIDAISPYDFLLVAIIRLKV